MHASSAASSSSNWHLKRPSQKRPVQRSSALARRASHSLARRMNQLTEPRRSRQAATRPASPAIARTLSSQSCPPRCPQTDSQRHATSSGLQPAATEGRQRNTRW